MNMKYEWSKCVLRLLIDSLKFRFNSSTLIAVCFQSFVAEPLKVFFAYFSNIHQLDFRIQLTNCAVFHNFVFLIVLVFIVEYKSEITLNFSPVMASDLVPENVLREEFELTACLRRTMSSSAVSKDVPKFHAFCKQLIALPYEKRFSFAFDFFESIDGYPKIKLKSMKSSVEALKFKNLGNAAFRQGDFVEALKLYTKSVAVAHVDSQDLAVAYGNRSAALFELQRYEGCIVDINRALGENFPEASRSKLLNRKQKCRSRMMSPNAAEFDQQKSMEKLSLEDNGCEMKKDCLIDEDALDLDYTKKFPLPKAKLKNKSISNASDRIKIEVNSTFGRHIVAVKDIEIGEIIGVEKAYASVLSKNFQYSHCANCFLRCEVLIPCPGCSAVMYCSRRCREDDFNRSHRIECQIYFYSYCLDIPLTSSLRLAIQTLMVVTKQGDNLKKLMKDPLTKNPMKQATNLVPEKLCSQNSVHLILSLLNDDRLFSYPCDPSSLSAAALFLYHILTIGYILRQTTYFDTAMVEKAQKLDNDSTEERKYVGLIFLKLMISIPRHTLGVYELLQKKVSEIILHADGLHIVGNGLYLFHSLFNHSCCMNVTGSFYKDTLVTQAIQPIRAGQQLSINYGPYFLMVPRNERQEDLRLGYQFDCRCEACKEDWPLLNEMSNDWSSLLNSDRPINLPQLLYYGDEIVKFYENPLLLIEYNANLFNFFCKYLTIFHQRYKKPISENFYALIVFVTLLQSRGNNYVYTRDDVLMSL